MENTFDSLIVLPNLITREQSQELGFTGGVACSGKAKGHWCVQLHAYTHERTNAELQNSSCSATGKVTAIWTQ